MANVTCERTNYPNAVGQMVEIKRYTFNHSFTLDLYPTQTSLDASDNLFKSMQIGNIFERGQYGFDPTGTILAFQNTLTMIHDVGNLGIHMAATWGKNENSGEWNFDTAYLTKSIKDPTQMVLMGFSINRELVVTPQIIDHTDTLDLLTQHIVHYETSKDGFLEAYTYTGDLVMSVQALPAITRILTPKGTFEVNLQMLSEEAEAFFGFITEPNLPVAWRIETPLKRLMSECFGVNNS